MLSRRDIAAVAFAVVATACGSRSGLDDLLASTSTSGGQDGSIGADAGDTEDGAVRDGSIGDARIDGFASDGSASDAHVGADVSAGCENVACGDGACCANGTCIPITAETNELCGWTGVCFACPSGGRCFKGSCIIATPNCGSSNCAGCCFDANTCADGLSQRGCGAHGSACVSCFNTSTPTCVPQSSGGGQCGTVAHCDPASCHGCCDGDTCRLGNAASTCGIDGEACHACGAGETCVSFGINSGGVCELPPFCTPSSCPNGCCDKSRCAPGNEDRACGLVIDGSGACYDCRAVGKVCVDGHCVDGCTATSCPTGCCKGNVCAQGDQAFACGTGAAACEDCTATHRNCVNHTCLL